MLAEHPDVLERLREEILTKVGPNRRPTYEDIKDMRYLRAVINGSYSLCWLRDPTLRLTFFTQKRSDFTQLCEIFILLTAFWVVHPPLVPSTYGVYIYRYKSFLLFQTTFLQKTE